MLPLPAGREASSGVGAPVYERHRPERTLTIQACPGILSGVQGPPGGAGDGLAGVCPAGVRGLPQMRAPRARILAGALRHLSCRALGGVQLQTGGFCPSCGARRMAESAALLVDEVFPEQPVRQWVLSFPYPLRFVFASRPAIMGQVLGIVYRVIATHMIKKAGFSCKTAHTGAVALIQRFGSALNLNKQS